MVPLHNGSAFISCTLDMSIITTGDVSGEEANILICDVRGMFITNKSLDCTLQTAHCSYERVLYSTDTICIYTSEIQTCASVDLLMFVENSRKRPINEKKSTILSR